MAVARMYRQCASSPTISKLTHKAQTLTGSGFVEVKTCGYAVMFRMSRPSRRCAIYPYVTEPCISGREAAFTIEPGRVDGDLADLFCRNLVGVAFKNNQICHLAHLQAAALVV